MAGSSPMKVLSFEIRVACEHCGAVGKLPPSAVNRLVKCPRCSKTFLAVADKNQVAAEPVFEVASEESPRIGQTDPFAEIQIEMTHRNGGDGGAEPRWGGISGDPYLATYTRSSVNGLYRLRGVKKVGWWWQKKQGEGSQSKTAFERKDFEGLKCPNPTCRHELRVHHQAEGCGGIFCRRGAWRGEGCAPDPKYGHITREGGRCPICDVYSIWEMVERNWSPLKVPVAPTCKAPELVATYQPRQIASAKPLGLAAPLRKLLGGK